MKCLKISELDNFIPEAHTVPGTTMTVPGLAPSLIELINSSLAGEPLPLTHTPLFDDSVEAGTARVMASQSDLAASYEAAETFMTEVNVEEPKVEEEPQANDEPTGE